MKFTLLRLVIARSLDEALEAMEANKRRFPLTGGALVLLPAIPRS